MYGSVAEGGVRVRIRCVRVRVSVGRIVRSVSGSELKPCFNPWFPIAC